MTLCPKCNNEYDEQLGKCPICGYNPQQEVEQLLEEAKSHYHQEENPLPYHDGFEGGLDDAPQATDDAIPSTSATPPVQDTYHDDFDNPVKEEENGPPVPEKLQGYNVDVRTAYDKKKRLPLGVKIVIAIVVILAVLIGAMFLSGVVKVEDGNVVFHPESIPGIATQETNPSDATSSSGQLPTNAQGEVISGTDPAGGGTSSALSSNGESQNTSSGSGTGNSSSLSSSSASGGSSSAPASSGTSSSSSSQGSSGGSSSSVTINGETFHVGDTVTYTAYLGNINPLVCGVQAVIHYDSSLLEVDPSSLSFPNLSGVVSNAALDDAIYFNCSNIDGFEFAQEHPLVSVIFTIQDAASTACDIDLEFETLIDFDSRPLEGDLRQSVTKA